MHILLLTTYVTYVSFKFVMEDQEQTIKKIQAGTNLDPAVFVAVERLRLEEDRPMSNMIERLLKTHPRVQAQMAELQEALAT